MLNVLNRGRSQRGPLGLNTQKNLLVQVLAAQCFRDEYTGPWSDNSDIEVSGKLATTDRCRERNYGD
jgi:hypothetical protein